jgi:phosphatidylglycerophosphate synthase
MPGATVRCEVAVLRRSAAWHVAAGLLAVGLGAIALRDFLALGPAYVPAALSIALLGAAAILLHLPGRHPHGAFGAANEVTLGRAVVTALVAGFAVEPGSTTAAAVAAACGTAVVVLDGIDGYLARRQGLASEFGARFDMETDALLVLALAILAWRWDRAGAWVVLSGAARYLFVGAAALLPWMRQALPPSRRRQAVCVVQIVVLLAVVAPLLPRSLAEPLAFVGLTALAYSFAVDVLWLARHVRRTDGEGP